MGIRQQTSAGVVSLWGPRIKPLEAVDSLEKNHRSSSCAECRRSASCCDEECSAGRRYLFSGETSFAIYNERAYGALHESKSVGQNAVSTQIKNIIR